MTILDEIIANTKVEVQARKEFRSISNLVDSDLYSAERRSAVASVRNGSGIISEIKKKSPSKGDINPDADVVAIGTGYEAAGASVISVLTDMKYFGGRMEYLREVRSAVNIPVLRKDFIVDEYQLYEARSIGADLILLIAAGLEENKLKSLASKTKELGMEVLLEVHDKDEYERYMNEFVDIVGVNNRNLKTFDVSIQTSIDLAETIADSAVKISESGLKDADTLKELTTHGYDGFLIGESFMKTDNPPAALKELIDQL